MPTLPPVFVELKSTAKEFISGLDEGTKHVEELGKKGASSGEMLRQKLGGSMVAAGAAVTAAGGVMFEMGEKLELKHKELETAVSNTGHEYEEYAKKIDTASDREAKFGHSSADTQAALTVLTRATGDTNKALGDMELVTELAAAKHTSLATAAATVARMHAGAYKPLKEFGINIKDNAKAAKEAEKAEKDEASSSDALGRAKQKLADTIEIQRSKAKLSVQDHIALRDAQAAVMEATAKHDEAAKRLWQTHEQSTKAVDFNAASTMILAKIHGTAEAQADTFGGKILGLKTHLENMAATVGQKVGPAMVTAGPLLAGLGGIVTSDLTPKIGEAIVSFAKMAAGAVASFAQQVVAAATWAAGMVASAATAMVPFLPWIALLAAVGAAAYLLYRNWDTVWSAIKSATSAAWSFIKGVFDAVWGGIKSAFDASVRAVGQLWSDIWGGIKTVITGAWDGIKFVVQGGFDFVRGLFQREVATWKAVWDMVWGGIKATVDGVWHGIVATVKGGVNLLISAINTLIRGLNAIHIHIPSVGIGPIHTPSFDLDPFNLNEIPFLAAGAIVSRPTLAMIGEAGPEAVVPLGGTGFGGLSPLPSPAGGSSGGASITIEEGAVKVEITGASVVTVDDVQHAIDKAFMELVRELRSR